MPLLPDQMPGGYNSDSHEVLSDSHVYPKGGWQEFSGSVYNSDSAYFGNNDTSSTYDMIWDKSCPT